MERDYLDPTTMEPFPGVPRFWKRVWQPGPAGERQGTFRGRPALIVTPDTPEGGLVIYGYSARSEYPEDRPVENRAWAMRRTFPSICFSVKCRDGEWGFTPVDEVQEITEQEFAEAAGRGWTP